MCVLCFCYMENTQEIKELLKNPKLCPHCKNITIILNFNNNRGVCHNCYTIISEKDLINGVVVNKYFPTQKEFDNSKLALENALNDLGIDEFEKRLYEYKKEFGFRLQFVDHYESQLDFALFLGYDKKDIDKLG